VLLTCVCLPGWLAGWCAGGTGEYTDYYLYITTLQDEHCQSGAVAWALPCLYDLDSNRPLLGAANLCPEMFAKTSQDASVSVLVHELLHALVSQGVRGGRAGQERQGVTRCGWGCAQGRFACPTQDGLWRPAVGGWHSQALCVV
jgi:hypothetical protein